MKYLRKCAKYLSWNMFELFQIKFKYVLISGISGLENILLVLSLEPRVLTTCLAALPSLCDGQVSLTIYDYVSRHRLLCLPSVKFCFVFVPWHRLFFVFYACFSKLVFFNLVLWELNSIQLHIWNIIIYYYYLNMMYEEQAKDKEIVKVLRIGYKTVSQTMGNQKQKEKGTGNTKRKSAELLIEV